MAKSKLTPTDYDHVADRAACFEVMVNNYLAAYPGLGIELTDHALNAVSALKRLHEAAKERGSKNANTLHDRASWLCETVSDLLAEHPTIKSDKKAHKSAHSAMCRLWTLYQYLAEKWFNASRSNKIETEQTITKP